MERNKEEGEREREREIRNGIGFNPKDGAEVGRMQRFGHHLGVLFNPNHLLSRCLSSLIASLPFLFGTLFFAPLFLSRLSRLSRLVSSLSSLCPSLFLLFSCFDNFSFGLSFLFLPSLLIKTLEVL